MCVYSMIYDFGSGLPGHVWNPNRLDEFKKIIDATKKMDKAAGNEDCEDPKKSEFMKDLEKRVAALEGKKAKKKKAKKQLKKK